MMYVTVSGQKKVKDSPGKLKITASFIYLTEIMVRQFYSSISCFKE